MSPAEDRLETRDRPGAVPAAGSPRADLRGDLDRPSEDHEATSNSPPRGVTDKRRARGGVASSGSPGGDPLETSESPGTALDKARGGLSGDPRATSTGPATHQDRAGTRGGHRRDLHETREGPIRDLGGARTDRNRVPARPGPLQAHFRSRGGMRGHLWRLSSRIEGAGTGLDGGRVWSSQSWPRWSASRPGGAASGPPCGPHTSRLPAQRPPEGPGQTERQRSLSYGAMTFHVSGARGSNNGVQGPGCWRGTRDMEWRACRMIGAAQREGPRSPGKRCRTVPPGTARRPGQHTVESEE